MAATICFTSAILGKQKGTPLCVYIGQVPFGTLITSHVLIFAIFCGPRKVTPVSHLHIKHRHLREKIIEHESDPAWTEVISHIQR